MKKITILGLLILIPTVLIAASTQQVETPIDISNTQWIINTLLMLISALGGWVLKFLHTTMMDLQKTDIALADKVHGIDVLVAGEYLKRSEFKDLSAAIFLKLDRIESKLDDKMDKKE